MAEWWFYHLERARCEEAAPALVEKCLERGWRVLAVSPNEARRRALDQALWTYDDNAFLPHAELGAEGCEAPRQPVLIAPSPDNLNQSAVALLLDGVALPPNAPFERCMVMFEGGDEAVRATARTQFAAAREAGLTTRYFQQAGRGWKEAGKA